MRIVRTHEVSQCDLEQAVEQAATLLRAGALIVMPTETAYGVFADAHVPEALAKLETLTVGRGSIPPPVRHNWHAASLGQVLSSIPIRHALHRVLLRRLLPGPVRFDVELEPDELATVTERLGVKPGELDEEGAIGVRVPAPVSTRHVLDLVGAPVVANRVAAAGWGPDRDLTAAFASEQMESSGIEAVFDEGLTTYGGVSTLLRLTREGGYRMVRCGVFDQRMIDKHAKLNILFVCTGNTCRSPMAEAIARSLLEQRGHEGIRVTVTSAGTAAGPGRPASPQTAGALRELGIEPGEHRSRPLSRRLVAESDLIFAMSDWHREEVEAIDPGASTRTLLLDPSGNDVPDPVGLPQDVYNQTAAQLHELILARLRELDVLRENTV